MRIFKIVPKTDEISKRVSFVVYEKKRILFIFPVWREIHSFSTMASADEAIKKLGGVLWIV